MSYATFLSRIFGKRPVWLFKITVGGTSYHVTPKGSGYTTPNNSPSTDFPTGQTWAPTPIQRGEIRSTSKANRTDTWLLLPTGNSIITAIIANQDEVDDATVEMWQGFIGDPDNEFQLMFSGRIADIEPAMLFTRLILETSLSKARRSSVAQVVQRSCRHAHYFTNSDGGGCRLVLADHQTTEAVTSSVGRALTVPTAASQSDGYYLAGVLEYGGVEYLIESHIGDQITVEKVVEGLAAAIVADGVSEDVLLAPGCDLSAENCAAFDNLVNFGGFNDMTDSPFDGRSIA